MVDTLWSCLDESCPKFNIVKIKFKNISTMRRLLTLGYLHFIINFEFSVPS